MNRLRALRSIAKLLTIKDGELVVAVEPDHPLLFSGPDILAGGNGRIVTFFLPKLRELRRPDILLARLAITRLALPATMHAALLVGASEGAEELGNLMHRDFDEVVELENSSGIVQFALARRNRRPEDISSLREIKKEAIGRFEALYTFSYEQILDESKGAPKERVMKGLAGIRSLADPPSWTGNAGRLGNLYQVGGANVAFLQLGKRGTLEKIRPLCVAGLMLDYSLDNGIPYPRGGTLNMIFSEGVPAPQFDPLKPIRAAAFAGWAFSTPESGEEAQGRIEELSRKVPVHLR